MYDLFLKIQKGSKMTFRKYFPAILLVFLLVSIGWEGIVNSGFLISQANQDADLTMTDVPHNLVNFSTEFNLRWTPDVRGSLRYSTSFRGHTPEDYQNLVDEPVLSENGHLVILGGDLPVGIIYCIIDGGDEGFSAVFRVIRAAEAAPEMTSPITGVGRAGIETVTPTIRWQPVEGVPYYHILLSDQPFDITEDEEGQVKVEGANIIWQAITSQTSIMYGIPDPSEYFDAENTPPLVGHMDRDARPRYTWIVLNNYGNHPAYTSTITGGVSGFEIEVEPPFDPPELVSPEAGAEVAGEEIIFRWTQVPRANSYFIYVAREEITPGGSQGFMPIWNEQTTFSTIACPAGEIFSNGRFVWKVLAANQQGRGALSDTASFSLFIETGEVVFRTYSAENRPLENTEVAVETIEGVAFRPFATDDNGYHLHNMPVGTYIFHGQKAGFSEEISRTIEIEADERYAVNLTLDPLPASVVGSVEDEDGEAVSRATIVALNRQTGSSFSTETDIGGEFQIDVDPGAWAISATADGFAPSEETSIQIDAGQNYDFNAEHGPLAMQSYAFTVAGVVRNPGGQPIHLAEVIIQGSEGQRYVTHTPESGTYSFVVGIGEWIMNASKPGFYLESGNIPVEITNRDITQNFTLVPQAGILSGQTFINNNLANRNVDVWFIPDAGEVVIQRVSQIGAFSRGISPGSYRVLPIRAGYSSRDTLVVDVGPGETISGLRLDLWANPSSIAGRITDAANNALAGATVVAGGVSGTTGQDGTYRLQVSEGNHIVRATKAGYVTAEVGPVAVQAGQNVANNNLRLTDNAGVISGRVFRGNDAIFDAVVTATKQANDEVSTTRTDQQGNYSFGLRSGTYRLTVNKSGFVAAQASFIDVQLNPGQEVTDRNFPMLNYSARITGLVRSAGGPVSTPSIRIVELNNPNNFYTTNGNVEGRFSLTLRPELSYIVIATKAGYSTERDTTAQLEIEGSEATEFQLTALPCQISGTIRVNDAPLEGATVRANSDANSYTATTGGGGTYQINLGSGDYTVQASKPGYTAAELEIRLNPGERRSGIILNLEENFSLISGNVFDPDNNAIADATVLLVEVVSGRRSTQVSDQDGAYTFERLVPGDYGLSSTHPQYAAGSLNVGDLLAGQERHRLTIQITPLDAEFAGVVRANGNPVSGVTVYAEADGEEYSTNSDNNGLFAFPNVGAGRYSFMPGRVGYTGVELDDQQVDPGDSLFVELEMIRNDGRITGFVRDPEGDGLRGARISTFDDLGHFVSATTNPAGAFTIENLYPLTQYTVTALLQDYQAEEDTLTGIDVGSEVVFAMRPNSLQVSGQVKNQINQPLAETEVHAISLVDGSVKQAIADGNGNYLLTGMAANTAYRFQTYRLEEVYTNVDRVIETGINHIEDVDLVVLESSSTLSGECGVRQVSIEITNRQSGRVRNAYSGAGGNYTFIRLREGDYVIRASKIGYRVTPDSLVVAGLGVNDERTGLNFQVQEITVSMTGSVSDSDDQLASYCPVLAWSEAGQFRDTTDQNGGFCFVGIYPNQLYRLATDLPIAGYENGTVDVPMWLNDTTGVRLGIIRHNANLSGTITSARNGDPLVSAFLTLDDDTTVATNACGFYEIDHLTGGVHQVSLNKWGHLPIDVEINTCNGEGDYVFDTELVPFERAIFGQAFFAGRDQFRLENCFVELKSSQDEFSYDTTDVNGRFFFDHLDPERSYIVTISKKGFVTRQTSGISVVDGSYNNTYNLPAMENHLSGLFTSDVRPIANAPIHLKSFEGAEYVDTTDFAGDYSIPVEAGRYMLMAEHPVRGTGTSYTQNVIVAGSDPLYIPLTLANTAVIVGQAVSDEGNPPQTATFVNCRHEATGIAVTENGDDEGVFLLQGLRPGNQNISVQAAGYGMLVTPLIVEATTGDTTRVVVTMTQSCKAITGFVLDQDSEPVARAKVAVTGPTSGNFITTDDGYFYITGPEPGDYSIHVERNGYEELQDTTFSIEAGEILQVDRTLTLMHNAVSGRISDDYGVLVNNVMVTLSLDGVEADTAYTNTYGEYIFSSRSPGDYSFKPVKEYYSANPASRQITLEADAGYINRDFTIFLVRGEGDVAGIVNVEGVPAEGVSLVMSDLDTYQQYRTTTDSSGAFGFEAIPAPATYRIRASKDGIVEITDESFRLLMDSTASREINFPTGKISVRLVDKNGLPIFNRAVHILGDKLNWLQAFYTNQSGVAESFGFLPAGTYTVQPMTEGSELPVRQRTIQLGDNEQLALDISMGWEISPPPPFSFNDSARVEINIPVNVEVSENRYLYWKGPGAVEWESRQLMRDIASGFDNSARTVRRVGSHDVVRDEPGGLYYAYIPKQNRCGTLQYYLEVNTVDGFVFGGPLTVQEVQITNEGMLDHVEFSRSISALNPRIGVPVTLKARAYDDQENDLTDLLGSEAFEWSQDQNDLGELIPDADDPTAAVYIPVAIGAVKINLIVRQIESQVTVRSFIEWNNENRILNQLTIIARGSDVASGESIVLSVSAVDTSGVLMPVLPNWHISDENVGWIEPIESSMEARLHINPGKIGMIRIGVVDSLSGKVAYFNEEMNDPSDRGLAIYGKIRQVASVDTLYFEDGNGFIVEVPTSSIEAGSVSRLFLQHPQLPSVMRVTTLYESSAQGYELRLEGSIGDDGVFGVVLPVPEEFAGRPPLVGLWDTQTITWVSVEGEYLNDDTQVRAEFNSLTNLYSFLVASEPLGVEGLKFLPNPFSPENDIGGVSIEFVLQSNLADRLPVTLKIHNMAGELIRTLRNGELMEKGNYSHESATLGHSIIWDGMTDAGRMARNGRYIVVLTAKDPSGEQRQIGTVVLVK